MNHYIPPQNPDHAQVEQVKETQGEQKLWANDEKLEAEKRQREIDRQIAEEIASRDKQSGQGG